MLKVPSLENITVMEMLGYRKKVAFLSTSMLLSCNQKTKVPADVHMADMCGIKSLFMESVTSEHNWRKWDPLRSCRGDVSVSNGLVKHIENPSQHTWFSGAAAQWRDRRPWSSKDQSDTRVRQGDGLCAVVCYPETRRPPSVPPCWYTAAHAALWD